MASVTIFEQSRAPARGVELAVMRLSVAMFRWARNRADRAAMSHDDYERIVQLAAATERREHESLLTALRVR